MATLSHEELIVKCTQVLESYDPKRTTVDAHLDDIPVLTSKKMSYVDTKFVSQVFYGCIRYQKLLRLFVNSFLMARSRTLTQILDEQAAGLLAQRLEAAETPRV